MWISEWSTLDKNKPGCDKLGPTEDWREREVTFARIYRHAPRGPVTTTEDSCLLRAEPLWIDCGGAGMVFPNLVFGFSFYLRLVESGWSTVSRFTCCMAKCVESRYTPAAGYCCGIGAESTGRPNEERFEKNGNGRQKKSKNAPRQKIAI